MPPQEMPDGQGRMIESAEVAHPQPPHHPLRTKVHRRRKGVHPRQSQPAEGIVQHGPRRFGGIALPPDLGDEPPSDLDTGCKRRLEGRTVQPRQPDQPSVPASFDGIQSPTGLRPFGDDPIEESVRLRPRQRVREKLHYPPVGIHRGQRLPVLRKPLPQPQPLRLQTIHHVQIR